MSKFIAKCPICGEGDIVEEKHFLSSRIYCTNCGTEFAVRGNEFKITKYSSSIDSDVRSRLVARMDEWHTLYEWRSIAERGYTEKEQIYINALQGKLPALPSISTNIIIHRGEVPYLEEQSELLEPHSVRTYTGGTRGVSVPIPGLKGVRYRVGGLKGTSESHEELRKIDSGVLLLTNKKLVFSGNNRVKTIKLEKIVQVFPYKDAIKIAIDGRRKPSYFTVSDGKLWSNAIEGLCSKA
jgi:transcription elongation factor Elf1